MKNLFFTFCLALILSPLVMNAQSECFTSTNDVWDFEASMDNGVDCALPQFGGGCTTVSSNPTYVSLHSILFDNCDLWCINDGPNSNFTADFQAGLFADLMDLLNANAPTCQETGMPMVVLDVELWLDVITSSGGLFLNGGITYACCELPQDCEADFDIDWNVNTCEYEVTNASSPSSGNDCGDCVNPSGITSASWSAYTIHGSGPIQWLSPYANSDEFNFTFSGLFPAKTLGVQVCLTIEDCVGCTDRTCKTIYKFSPCFGLTGENDEEESLKKIEPDFRPLNVFPNPASDYLSVQVNDVDFDESISHIEIYDMQGRLTQSLKSIETGINQINVNDYAPGVYILKLTVNGEHKHAEKIVIE